MKHKIAVLMSRGLSSDESITLDEGCATVAQIELMTPDQLRGKNLSEASITTLRSRRPPIPLETVYSIVYRSRYTCVVCRDSKKPVVIHHLIEWSKSRDNNESNLILICSECHARAHSNSSLERSLSIATLKRLKAEWYEFVQARDIRSILDYSSRQTDLWWNYNIFRIIEAAKGLGLNLSELDGYSKLLEIGIIDSSGNPCPPNHRDYMFEQMEGSILRDYVTTILKSITESMPINNASDFLDRRWMKVIAAPGQWIYIQGAYTCEVYCRSNNEGVGQYRYAKRTCNNITVRFLMDIWESSSMSACARFLDGRLSCGALLRVNSVILEGEHLIVDCTHLAICGEVSGLKKRNYDRRHIS